MPFVRGRAALFAIAAIAAGVVCATCASPTAPPAAKPAPAPRRAPVTRPICAVETSAGAEKEPRDRTYPAQNWFVLMLHAYRSVGEIARPLNDCSGRPVKLDIDGCGNDPVPELVPTALTTEDLIVTPLGDERRLVWVITEQLSDGQAQGPVAIASVEPRGIAVRALGVLRAFRENVSLRLEQLGGVQVLVADGQRCASPGAPETCERAIRVVPLVGDRFVPGALMDDKGACLGTTLFPVRTKGQAGGPHGATYELEAAANFSQGALVIREQLAISRAAHARGAKDGAEEAFIARLQLERSITTRDGRLVTDGPSLLTRWLRQRQKESADDHP